MPSRMTDAWPNGMDVISIKTQKSVFSVDLWINETIIDVSEGEGVRDERYHCAFRPHA